MKERFYTVRSKLKRRFSRDECESNVEHKLQFHSNLAISVYVRCADTVLIPCVILVRCNHFKMSIRKQQQQHQKRERRVRDKIISILIRIAIPHLR